MKFEFSVHIFEK